MEAFAPSHASLGQAVTIELEGISSLSGVYSNVRGTSEATTRTTDLDADGSGELRLPLPRHNGPATVTIAWDQAAGAASVDSPACSGTLTLDVSVVRGRVGDLERPLVDGSWTLRLKGARAALRWQAVPTCAVGGCDFAMRLQGSPPATYRYKLRADGTYRSSRRYRQVVQGCEGEKAVARVEEEETLRVTHTKPRADGSTIATRMTGYSRVRVVPIPGTRLAARCNASPWNGAPATLVRR
ncbi:hypothetical protein Q7L65_09890 [Conexibacter sp. CPCC 206217]|nr:hypothetical protein [Conexibacter sp. CPCC 206217]